MSLDNPPPPAASSTTPPAGSASHETFKTYEEYENYLQQAHREVARELLSYRDCANLWLAHFDDQGESFGWYRHSIPYFNYTITGQHPTAANPYQVVKLRGDFNSLLTKSSDVIAYQVVILQEGRYWSRECRQWARDVLGLGLDLDYNLCNALIAKSPGMTGDSEYHMLLKNNSPILRIGEHVLAILEAIPGHRPKTVLIVTDRAHHSFTVSHERSGRFKPRLAECDASLPLPGRPSMVYQHSITSNLPVEPKDRDDDASFIRRYLGNNTHLSLHTGQLRHEAACIAALVELHLEKAPRYMPVIESGSLALKYYYITTGLDDRVIQVDPTRLWTSLASEIAEQKTTVSRLPQLFQSSLRMQSEKPDAVIHKLIDRFEAGVKELESGEKILKNYLTITGIKKSREMAERSIQESKRVMLLTALAFIFIPISLASSIYGMNVQEINSTGHSITAFLITALVMSATALASWWSIASFVSWRKRNKKRLELEMKLPVENQSVLTILVVHGLWGGRELIFRAIYRKIGQIRLLFRYFWETGNLG